VTGLGTDVKVVAIVLQPGEGALAADALDLAARQYSYVMLTGLGAAHVELEAGATAVDADDVHLRLPSSKARSSWRLRAHPGRVRGCSCGRGCGAPPSPAVDRQRARRAPAPGRGRPSPGGSGPGRSSSPCRRAWWWCRFRC